MHILQHEVYVIQCFHMLNDFSYLIYECLRCVKVSHYVHYGNFFSDVPFGYLIDVFYYCVGKTVFLKNSLFS